MDSQQLIEYLFLSKASIRRALAELDYAGEHVDDFRHAVDTIRQHLQLAMENTRSAITEMAEITQAETVDELDAIFNKGTAPMAEDDFFAAPENQALYSRACELTLRKGKINTEMLENRLEIDNAMATRLIEKLIEEEIVSSQPLNGDYLIINVD